MLTEGAEQLFGTLVSIHAELEGAHESGSALADKAFARAFGSLATTLDVLANAVDDTVIAWRRGESRAPTVGGLAVPTEWANVHCAPRRRCSRASLVT